MLGESNSCWISRGDNSVALLQSKMNIAKLIGSQANWIELFQTVDKLVKINGTQIVTIVVDKDNMLVLLYAVKHWPHMAVPIVDDLLEAEDGIVIEVRNVDQTLLKRQIFKRSVCNMPAFGSNKLIIIENPVTRIEGPGVKGTVGFCVCKKMAFQCCSSCKVMTYCSTVCQQQDWVKHCLVCEKMKSLVKI